MNMELFVIRHARAADGELYGEDGDRPLTPEGRQHALEVGRALHRHGAQFDRIISSPYVRAVETAELILVGMNFADGLLVSRQLVPEASAGQIVSALLELHRDCPRLAIVGHEPSLGSLLSVLLQRKNIHPGKGACVALHLADPRDLKTRAELRWVITPHHLEPKASLDIL